MTGQNRVPVPALRDDPTDEQDLPGLDDFDLLGAEREQREGRDLAELWALRALLGVMEEEGVRVDDGASCYGRP